MCVSLQSPERHLRHLHFVVYCSVVCCSADCRGAKFADDVAFSVLCFFFAVTPNGIYTFGKKLISLL